MIESLVVLVIVGTIFYLTGAAYYLPVELRIFHKEGLGSAGGIDPIGGVVVFGRALRWPARHTWKDQFDHWKNKSKQTV